MHGLGGVLRGGVLRRAHPASLPFGAASSGRRARAGRPRPTRPDGASHPRRRGPRPPGVGPGGRGGPVRVGAGQTVWRYSTIVGPISRKTQATRST
ncbi:hypothetical protein FFI11_015755 [Oerskovia sp. KBS0722]|nr:hypothetical protein FFI11_015755 [Oerskovia sp. KBS0722]